MSKTHDYSARLRWDGNLGDGTKTYTGYGRDYVVAVSGKHELRNSADPMFRGNPELHNPEELFLASISGCHMLTYLALCAKHKINVIAYEDSISGTLELTPDGGGKFQNVMLRPVVTITDEAKTEAATKLHDDAHRLCFIAQSCSAPIHHEPTIRIAAEESAG